MFHHSPTKSDSIRSGSGALNSEQALPLTKDFEVPHSLRDITNQPFVFAKLPPSLLAQFRKAGVVE